MDGVGVEARQQQRSNEQDHPGQQEVGLGAAQEVATVAHGGKQQPRRAARTEQRLGGSTQTAEHRAQQPGR